VQMVILPATVAPEVDELEAELKKALDIVYVDNFLDVFPLAFGAVEAGLQEQEAEGTA